MTTDPASARTAAITASGWGAPFRLLQLRNACFWVFCLAMAAGALNMVRYFGPGVGAYGVGLGTGVIAFAIYTVPWLLLLGHHNRYTSLPPRLLVVAFSWGAVAATFGIAIQANGAVLSLYAKAFGQGWVSDWGAGLTAPFTEETAKAMALVLLLGLAPRLVRSPYDGLMIGAFAGLGFQIIEDVLYAFNSTAANFGADQTGSVWQIVVLRTTTGLFGHVLFSAVFCAGVMWLLGRGDAPHRVRGLLLVVAAMLAHGCWDNLSAIGYSVAGPWGVPLLFIGLPVADLLLLWLTFRLAAPQERAWMRAILAPEAADGLLTKAELRAASGGRVPRSSRHVVAAANDLAHELARSGGRDNERVDHARAEIRRLRGSHHPVR